MHSQPAPGYDHLCERRFEFIPIWGFAVVLLAVRTHRELPLNYSRARKAFSSGIIEGLNNKAKVTMRKAYGFRTFKMAELSLYHVLGKLPEPNLSTISSVLCPKCARLFETTIRLAWFMTV